MVSKAEWINKIKKDLRGKTLEELYWNYKKDFTIDPFAHQEDLNHENTRYLLEVSDNNWKLSASFDFKSVQDTNTAILDFLTYGAQCLTIIVRDNWNIKALLDGVYLDMVSIVFQFHDSSFVEQFISNIETYLSSNNLTATNISYRWGGTIDESPMFYSKVEKSYSNPIIHVDSKESDEFDELLDLINKLYSLISDKSIEQSQLLLSQVVVHINIRSEFLFEIARIRAFKVLWYSLLKNIGVHQVIPTISIYTEKESSLSREGDMILHTVKGMIGVVASVDRIDLSYVNGANTEQFYERIAMNIQHLMKMEAKMNKVVDPVAGSYHFELLTTRIVEKVWDDFIST